MNDQHQDSTANKAEDITIMKTKNPSIKRSFARRNWLVLASSVLGATMILAAVLYAQHKRVATPDNTFDTAKVLPQAVTIPPSPTQRDFTAETIKQYDGLNGQKCYVAVNGKVYEIASKGQWKNGKHQPSSGQAYCGADMTAQIAKAPHGTSKLQELPVVGTFN